MKKLFLVVIAAMTMVFGSSFKPNTTSQQIQSNAKPQQDQCYAVRVYFDIVWETRTERWGMSAVVSNQTMQSTSLVTDICAENESKAKDDAVYECYKYCNNREGKYIKETKDGHFIFEVRRVTEVEILGTCGGC